MFKAKKKLILWVGIAGIFFLLIWKDGHFLKKLVGYNVPPLSSPSVTPQVTAPEGVGFLHLPAGLTVSVFAKDLSGPRVMAFDPKQRMLVSETKEGRVIILEDADRDEQAEKKTVLLSGLKSPHGLAFYTDPSSKTLYLYVAEAHQVARYRYNAEAGKVLSATGQNIVTYAADGRHTTRTIAFGPNLRKNALLSGDRPQIAGTLSVTKLYVSVGSSCDVCEEASWKRAAVLESDPDGNYTAEFAGGLRNAVFFTFHPVTGEIWATEMGRDNLGDNLPPDEINIVRSEEKYGWPFCYGKQIRDKQFSPAKIERTDLTDDCTKTIPSHIDIPAHSAPLGLAFITDKSWPAEWQNNLLVAYHGSWNRRTPTGYKIVRLKLDEKGQYFGAEDFITGWYDGKFISGRPADLKFAASGELFISDDAAGVIYKLSPK